VLYRPNSEHARSVEEFLHDLQREHDFAQRKLQVLDMDSRDGIAAASLYDIMSAPAIVVTDDVGGYIKSWTGDQLPMMQEVVGYTYES